MIRRECGLRGAWQYCKQHPALCCKACPDLQVCERACMNTPERCGYMRHHDTATYAPPGRLKGGAADGRKATAHGNRRGQWP